MIPLMLAIEAPSIKSSYNKGTTPEVYILLSNDPMCPSNHCGMLVSIRQDVYENIDQAIVEDVMMKLSQWLKAHKLLHSPRNFYAGSKARAINGYCSIYARTGYPGYEVCFSIVDSVPFTTHLNNPPYH
ncbi:hypothetical protein ACTP13_10855 [Paenibacillus peoriae]|uniref:hypothetical protein n=1 Tax=Paenibacillus peoriae TaxID=59893 RepID=UPI003F9D47AD